MLEKQAFTSSRTASSKGINLAEKFAKFSEHWSPKVVAELNDYQIKVAKFKGDFIWHKHDDTDEMFFVLTGCMSIAFRNHVVELRSGEMLVVKKGVEHKPFAEEECQVILIEPKGLVNTGEARSELTAENDIWV